ncbi:MAG: UDP-glucose/GDP-mannose dehydrogenase family protein [Actinomycetota bacterium]|nr:UDP-glucose/GDP-mannose dehydrogenase family protein [Actinomycetota bacterium]
MDQEIKCAVIGTGYVGLVTGACLADLGYHVICLDRDEGKLESLRNGKVEIFEAELEPMIVRNMKNGSLSFSADIKSAVSDSFYIFITVDTPSDETGRADITNVEEAARRIAPGVNSYKIIVNKSTVPVGSTNRVMRIIEESEPEYPEFDVVSNPEFLREGTAVFDFMNPTRIVIGSDSEKAIMHMTELYRPINAPLLITDPISAEMIKYASNAFLATKISYINAIANLCEYIGADVREVSLGMGYDGRIGFEFLKPGPGFGGSCFPKDTRALLAIATDYGYNFDLLKGTLEVNRRQRERMVEKLERMLGKLEEVKIAALGLSFKANTSDVRESPAIEIVRMLRDRKANVSAYDPKAMDNARKQLEGIEFADNPYLAARDADALVILTEWDEFKWLDYPRIAELMKRPIILDTRNLLDPQVLRKEGFTYEGVGR